jgi:hypothetical protein
MDGDLDRLGIPLAQRAQAPFELGALDAGHA